MALLWLGYALIISLLAGGIALLAERLLLRFGGPTRWAWVGGVAVSGGVPLASFFHPLEYNNAVRDVAAALPLPRGDVLAWVAWLRGEVWLLADRLPDLWLPVGVVLGAGAVCVVAWLWHSARTLSRRSNEWEERTIDGRRCWVTAESGPAVVGLFRQRLVVPRWLLDLAPERRRMVLAHEEEHLRRRDPWLLLVPCAVLLLFAWNPVVWWQYRRLRLAVEVDCDRRVTSAGCDRSAYSRLLLSVGRRRAPGPATPLVQGGSDVGRRIRRLMEPSESRGWTVGARAVAIVLVASLLVFVPRPVAPLMTETPDEPGDMQTVPYDEHPECVNCTRLERRLNRRMRSNGWTPDTTRVVPVGMFVSSRGETNHVFVDPRRSFSSPAAREAVVETARRTRWAPARLGGRPLGVWLFWAYDPISGRGS